MDAVAVSTRSPARTISTPTGLKVAIAVTAAAVVVFGVLASRSVITRRAAADSVRHRG